MSFAVTLSLRLERSRDVDDIQVDLAKLVEKSIISNGMIPTTVHFHRYIFHQIEQQVPRLPPGSVQRVVTDTEIVITTPNAVVRLVPSYALPVFCASVQCLSSAHVSMFDLTDMAIVRPNLLNQEPK